jgi:hypothetical protein
MATWNLPITVPDAQQTRILNALKTYYANNGTPNPTNAQVQEYLRLEMVAKIKGIVRGVEEAAAAAAVTPTDPS